MIKKILSCALVLSLVFSISACSAGVTDNSGFKVGMVTDVGGINDQSFNQSAWKGMQRLRDDYGTKISYLESKQESEYTTNLEIMSDQNNDIVWGIGYAMADAILDAAQTNEDIHYALIDNEFENPPENLTGVVFKTQDAAFLVGYIAALTTKTNKVGFVGGETSVIIDQFEYGYKAGVNYGAKERNQNISISVQYADSFTDAAKGKAIANKMYSDGCDIVFHASGGVGNGVIEAAKDNNKFAIGVDNDQAYLAPDNVLTSAMKNVDVALEDVSLKYKNGEEIGGKNFTYGIGESGVGIPQDHRLMGDETYNKAMQLEEKIKAGEIVPPATQQAYENFKA